MKDKLFIALSNFGKYGDDAYQILKTSGIDYKINDLGRRLTKEELMNIDEGFTGVVAGLEPYDENVLEK